MRIGELLALQWQDVDLVAGRINVRRNVVWGHLGTPKSGKSREIPLSNDALKALKDHRHLRGALMFCDAGAPNLTEGEVRHPLWRACKRAASSPVHADRKVIDGAHEHVLVASDAAQPAQQVGWFEIDSRFGNETSRASDLRRQPQE